MKLRYCITGCASAFAIAAVAMSPNQAIAADITVPAPIPTCEKPIDLTVYGHVHKNFSYVDNGVEKDTFIVDQDASETRFGFRAEGDIDCVNSIGAHLEFGAAENRDSAASLDQRSDAGFRFRQRVQDVYWDNDNYGRITLGHGGDAVDGVAEVGFGTGGIAGMYSLPSDTFSGAEITDGTNISSLVVGNAFTNYDGGRENRIMYTSPTFAGFQFKASLNDSEDVDLGIKYAGEIGSTKVAAGFGYSLDEDVGAINEAERFAGSIGVLFSGGISLSFAAGTQDVDDGRADGVFYYGKIGYQTDSITALGTTGFGIDYYYGEDILSNGGAFSTAALNAAGGDESQAFGVVITQDIDITRTNLYLVYKHYDIDLTNGQLADVGLTSGTENVDVVAAGARVRF